MQPLYLLTAVDVRRARLAGSTRKNTISKLALPGIKFAGAEHTAGGGVMGVNFALPRLEAPEPKFDGKGLDPDVFTGLGIVDRWTFAGSYKKKLPGVSTSVPLRAIIDGAITSWEPDESDPADFQGCSHSFTEVTHYELHLDGKELFYVDFWEGVLRVDGVDLWAEERNALGA